MTHGVAALLAGYFIAARWRATGVSSAGEFVYIRYGSSFCASVILKVLLPNLTQDGPRLLVAVAHWAGANQNLSEQFPGLLLPFVLLLWFEVKGRKENKVDEGWTRVRAFEIEHGMDENAIVEAGSADENHKNGLLIGLFMAGLAALFIIIGILVTEERFLMLVFAAMMLTVEIPLIAGGGALSRILAIFNRAVISESDAERSRY